jgi:AbrB family looped-hinge helix DNA binding protein
MENIQVTSLSSKGQVVIPNLIRKQLHLNDGSKFMIITDGNNILLKPIEIPKAQEFKNLIQRSKKLQSEFKLTKDDLNKVIKKARRESSN